MFINIVIVYKFIVFASPVADRPILDLKINLKINIEAYN